MYCASVRPELWRPLLASACGVYSASGSCTFPVGNRPLPLEPRDIGLAPARSLSISSAVPALPVTPRTLLHSLPAGDDGTRKSRWLTGVCGGNQPGHHLVSYTRFFSSTSLNSGDEGASHFKQSSVQHPLTGRIPSLPGKELEDDPNYTLPHPIWSREEAECIQVTHTPPKDKVDKAAYFAVRTMRVFFDVFSGYSWGKLFGSLDEKKWLTRIIFLETVAGVPGMIGAMTRHLKSLRLMQRDHGWIHTLLEEAENERMHLLTALELKNPGKLFKAAVVTAQGCFVSLFWIAYIISPRFCHRFVGYLEEEAVKTYTLCLECMDSGKLPMWEKLPAPVIAATYWRLGEGAMMRDVILAIRADEAHHRVVNHTLSNIKQHDPNPYSPGK